MVFLQLCLHLFEQIWGKGIQEISVIRQTLISHYVTTIKHYGLLEYFQFAAATISVFMQQHKLSDHFLTSETFCKSGETKNNSKTCQLCSDPPRSSSPVLPCRFWAAGPAAQCFTWNPRADTAGGEQRQRSKRNGQQGSERIEAVERFQWLQNSQNQSYEPPSKPTKTLVFKMKRGHFCTIPYSTISGQA